MDEREDAEFVDYVSGRLAGWHRAAYALCGSPHRADDIVQATVTGLYRHWLRARSADNLDAYVHRMLVRKHLDEHRRTWARERLLGILPDRPAPDPQPPEERHALRVALAALPRPQRTVIVLRYICDLSVDDTAAVLRYAPNTVKSHTVRGLAALRRILGDTARLR
jgi:RNA polymerase sigma-70 factor (sigma-E family)